MSRCQSDNIKRDFANERGKKREGEDREKSAWRVSVTRNFKCFDLSIYLINDQDGDRRVDHGVQNRVGDYGVVQRFRRKTFKQ